MGRAGDGIERGGRAQAAQAGTGEVPKDWAREWAKEGKEIDWKRLMPLRGYVALPRRWVVERTFAWRSQNRRMSLWTTRGCVRVLKRPSMLP